MFLGWSFLKIAKRIEIPAELWLPWNGTCSFLTNEVFLHTCIYFNFKAILCIDKALLHYNVEYNRCATDQ